jgi:uncharacterized protein YbaR (Trm112 family)
MTCLCPKCGAAINQENSGIPDDGSTTTCPACNSRLQIVKESYAKVAYGTLTGKSCASCGGSLGSGLICPACGALYPDFFVAADPAVLKRKARELKQQQLLAVFNGLEISLPSFNRGRYVKIQPVYKPKTESKTTVLSSAAKSNNLPKLIAAFLVVVILLGGGYAMYAKNIAEKQYIETYFKALYGIKTGVELSAKVTSRISSEWKMALDSGRSFSPLPSIDELTRLNKVKSEVDKMITMQLSSPPKKLAPSRDGLVKLNDQYAKLHALASSPPNNLAMLNDVAGKATASFDESAKSLKATLPNPMPEELANAKKKYKNLKDF